MLRGTILHTVLCFTWHGVPDLDSSLRLRATELNSHLTWQWYSNQRRSPLRPSIPTDLHEHSTCDRKSKPITAIAQLLCSLKDFNQGPEITLGNFTGRWNSQAMSVGPEKHQHLGINHVPLLGPLESLRASHLPASASPTATSRRSVTEAWATDCS